MSSSPTTRSQLFKSLIINSKRPRSYSEPNKFSFFQFQDIPKEQLNLITEVSQSLQTDVKKPEVKKE